MLPVTVVGCLFWSDFLALQYGMVSVALLLYLTELGFSTLDASVIFTSTLIGDLVITFYLTTTADLFGRKRTLLIGGMAMVGAGVVFAFVSDIYILIVAGIIGVITPSGGEIGPFLACEQAALTELIASKDDITRVFGWYNMTAYAAQALGSLLAGIIMDVSNCSVRSNSVKFCEILHVGCACDAWPRVAAGCDDVLRRRPAVVVPHRHHRLRVPGRRHDHALPLPHRRRRGLAEGAGRRRHPQLVRN